MSTAISVQYIGPLKTSRKHVLLLFVNHAQSLLFGISDRFHPPFSQVCICMHVLIVIHLMPAISSMLALVYAEMHALCCVAPVL